MTGSPSTRGARGLCLALRPTNSCVCGPVSHPRPREADCPPRSGRDPGTLGLPPPRALSGLQQKSGQGPFLFQLSEGFVWLWRAIGSSSLCPSGSPSGSPGRHGQRRPALTGHALLSPTPDGARSGGGPSPHLASASGDLNGGTDGRGRGDVTPQPRKRARPAKARIPRRPIPSLVSAFVPSSDSPCGSGRQTSGPHLLRHPLPFHGPGFRSPYPLLEPQRVAAPR